MPFHSKVVSDVRKLNDVVKIYHRPPKNMKKIVLTAMMKPRHYYYDRKYYGLNKTATNYLIKPSI